MKLIMKGIRIARQESRDVWVLHKGKEFRKSLIQNYPIPEILPKETRLSIMNCDHGNPFKSIQKF